VSETDLLDKLRHQNPELELTEKDTSRAKVLFRTGPRDKESVHWVIETPPDVLKKVENKKAFIGMCRCNMKLYTTMTQCFNCQRYGHTATRCKDAKPTCRNCAGEHDPRSCKSESIKCANCKGPHRASSSACKYKGQATQRVLRHTDFGA